MESFVRDFQKTLLDKSYGILHACADDLRGALLNIASLLIMHRIFKVMAKVSGLILQLAKCIIVPLVDPRSPNFFLIMPFG